MENEFNGAAASELVVKGLAEVELEEGFVPKIISPKFAAGFGTGTSDFVSALALSFRLSFGATSVILVPRNALTLPSLRLHVFRRHANTYRRLSCPGKDSGRSPFNCRSKTMRSLHILHFANAAEGGLEGSSHVLEETWSACDNLCFDVTNIYLHKGSTYGISTKLTDRII